MKKYILATTLLVFTLVTWAQEAAAETEPVGRSWSEETKTWLLAAFVVINILLVLRTFRNKPSA